MHLKRAFVALLAHALGAIVLVGEASAQQYPSRTITFVVPFPAGGLSDIAARSTAQWMSTLGVLDTKKRRDLHRAVSFQDDVSVIRTHTLLLLV